MNELLLAIPVVLITGLVQMAKMAGMPKRYAKTAAFGLALVLGVVYYLSASITQDIVTVLGFALSAIGVYETSKAVGTGIVNAVK